MKMNPNVARSVCLVFVAMTFFMLPNHKLPYLDQKAEAYYSDTMTKAAVAFGVCRMINASVSLIKDSQIQVEPAGLGVSIAAGQVLDPLDDMTERVSDIIVMAIISLGIQKIAYELSVTFVPSLLLIMVMIYSVISLLNGMQAQRIAEIVLKSIILILIARLSLPVSSIVSAHLNEHYFAPEITQAKDGLGLNTPEMERLKSMQMPKVDGVMDTVENGFRFVSKKISDLSAALQSMLQNMGTMINQLLILSYLYVTLFIIQVIVLPLGIFWFLTRLTMALLCAHAIPSTCRYQTPSKNDTSISSP